MGFFSKKKVSKWEAIKQRGSGHYKSSGIEPIDLYKDGGMLWDFAIASIIKYAYRNRKDSGNPASSKDIEKIKHYADMLILYVSEE